MPKPCGFSTPHTRMAAPYVDTPAPKATLLDLVYTHACGHAWVRPPEARLGRLVTLGAFICGFFC